MYLPSFGDFKEMAREGNLVPVYKEILADLETPVGAFYKIQRDSDYAYLLESVEGGEKIGQFSFLGSSPSIVLKGWGERVEITMDGEAKEERGDPLLYLKRLLEGFRPIKIGGLPRFWGGAVGYIGYDYIRHLERIPCKNTDPLGLPDLLFIITPTLLIFDHLRHTIKIVSNILIEGPPSRAYEEAIKRIDEVVEVLRGPLVLDQGPKKKMVSSEVSSNFTRDEFTSVVKEAKRYIRAGDIFQVVPSQRFSMKVNPTSFDIYRALRRINPSPYMYLLKYKEVDIIGSSPELLTRVEEGVVETRPIAGTRPRGKGEEEDRTLEMELLADEKECAEHVMLVDLGRNDLGRVCEYGSIHTPEFKRIERYSHVMHIVSSVKGSLSKEKDPFDALKACFPAGTVTGAPKIRAMEIIDELENVKRGVYAGCVGYFGFSGNLDSCITIRTIVIKDGVAHIQAGAGIVADSDPNREYDECCNKAKALINAIRMAEEGLE